MKKAIRIFHEIFLRPRGRRRAATETVYSFSFQAASAKSAAFLDSAAQLSKGGPCVSALPRL
jgi:hypothetical protein